MRGRPYQVDTSCGAPRLRWIDRARRFARDPFESRDAGSPGGRDFLFAGRTRKDETVLLVAPRRERKDSRRCLQERGASVENFRKRGKLHLSQGMDTPASHGRLHFADRRGVEVAFRVFGDMTWAKQKGWSLGKLSGNLKKTTNALPASARETSFLSVSLGELFRHGGDDGR